MPKRYIPNDSWSRKAKEEGFRARSVYKLEELDKRFRLIRNGMTVLDLGAAPGSWLQYTAKKIGNKGRAIGIDVQEIEPIAENVTTHQQDIEDRAALRTLLDQKGLKRVDLILSDLAPSTSGIQDVDQWRSIELSQAVLETAKEFLRPGGTCVIKVLRGADFDTFLRDLKLTWKSVHTAHVQASRDRSKEIYVIVH